jgi:chitin synthase
MAPWKILAFFGMCVGLANHSFSDLFTNYNAGFGNHSIIVQEIEPNFMNGLPDFSDIISDLYKTEILSKPNAIYSVLLWQVGSSYLCYIFTKFSCKIQIETVSFAFPINLTVPISITTLIIICGVREANDCAFHGMIPDYMFFNASSIFYFGKFIFRDSTWLWLLWMFSQAWVTSHLWNPKSDKNASTEMLFVTPMYNGLLIDQSLTLNRRREESVGFVKIQEKAPEKEPEILNEIDAKAKAMKNDQITARDKIPQIFVCATMWHETMEELMEFLKSLLRLDEDQCARRMAMKYIQLNKNEIDSEYYDLECKYCFRYRRI